MSASHTKLLPADEWLADPKYKGIEVLDPDGWDRSDFAASWAEPIDEREFNRRLVISTCSWPIHLLRAAADSSEEGRS